MDERVFTYCGVVALKDRFDASDVLFLGDDNEPLARRVVIDLDALDAEDERFDDVETVVPMLTARWFSSEEPKTFDEADADLLRHVDGEATIEYTDHYSDVTGYLWTDEWFKVGGHDIIAELATQAGRFACLEVTVREETEDLVDWDTLLEQAGAG